MDQIGKHFYTDGTPVVEGHCLKGADHHVQTITVTLRSSSSMVTADMVKAQLEKRYEVTSVSLVERKSYHPR